MTSDDLTARAKIRDCALRLFAESGPDVVTIRDIAACAGVSAGLVLHHFGSKQGLRDAVDAHVARIFDRLLERPDALDEVARGGGPAAASLAEVLLQGVPQDSPIPAYLRRLLLSGDPMAARLFRQWFDLSRGMLAAVDGTGATRPTGDPDTRAAFLMVNDLAMILFHKQIADVLGDDPLTPGGMTRWATEVMDVYTNGVFTGILRESDEPPAT